MSDLAERLNTPISTAELERRWQAIRAAMERAGIDVLYTHANHNEWGYVRYFTDLPQGGYGVSVVFPRDEPMTVITHGAAGGEVLVDPTAGGVMRGVKRLLTEPYFPGVNYCSRLDSGLALKALEPYPKALIGLVGAHQMVFPMVDSVQRGLSSTRFVDATDLVDAIKVVKSAEEAELVRRTAHLQDEAMRVAIETIKPGVREIEVTAAAEQYSQLHGSEYGLYMIGSAQPGDPGGVIRAKHQQQRVIRQGDVVSVLVENSGPGGFYCELGRTIVVGSPPPELTEEFEFVLEAQRVTVEPLRPGASCADMWAKYRSFMEENGRPQERRIHAHGQGYDLVERPLIRDDEPMSIAAGMNITCHPGYARHGMFCYVCDNFLVTERGPEHLHQLEQKIYEV